jgi:hypothetical protein
MQKSISICAAALLTACGVTATDNGANAADVEAQRPQQRPARTASIASAEATVRNFAVGAGAILPDYEFRFSFASAAEARRAYGPAAIDALAAAGIRYVPGQRQFRDGERAYMPLIMVGRGDAPQLVVRMNALDGDTVSLCQGCSSRLGMVQSGRITDYGDLDNNGLGASGAVHVLAQYGPVWILGVHVGWSMQGERGDAASFHVIGESGRLSQEIPLLRNSGARDVSASAPLLRRRVRLEGNRLFVFYPGARPPNALYRIDPSEVTLIEGAVPASLTEN